MDWPGEWHSPVILKLNIVGGQALSAHGWFLKPTPSASLMWEHCHLSVVVHPDNRPSFLLFGLALLLVSQRVAVYHLTHSITSAVGSLLPEVSHLIPCFLSGRREGQSPRMGRLALLPEDQRFQPSVASGSYAQIFSYTFYTQELCPHVCVRSAHGHSQPRGHDT